MPIVGALDRIKAGFDHLKPAEQRVASWILTHPSHASSLTVRELAKVSQSSQSAVIRLCHTLQFKSYVDLKLSVVADVSRGPETTFDFAEITPDSPFHSVIEELQKSLVTSLVQTLSGVTEESLENVSTLIHDSRKILVFGSGASAVVAKDIQQKLQRLGFSVWTGEDFHTAATIAAQFGPKDVLIAVSYSGRTTDVLEITQIVYARKSNIVAITQYGESPLQALSNVILPVMANEVAVRIGASGSLLASLAVVNSVLVYYVNRYPESSVSSLNTTRAALASHLKS